MKSDKKQENSDNKDVFDIPIEGSLGLLAAGDIGLRMWRDAIKKSSK